MVYYDNCVFSEEITKRLQTGLLRPGFCQARDQCIGILPTCVKPLQNISAYRSMCKLHILNLDFKEVMSINEMALRVDGPNIEPTLSPYPPRPRPAVLAGNPPRSPHPRLLACTQPTPQKCFAGSPPRHGAALADL